MDRRLLWIPSVALIASNAHREERYHPTHKPEHKFLRWGFTYISAARMLADNHYDKPPTHSTRRLWVYFKDGGACHFDLRTERRKRTDAHAG